MALRRSESRIPLALALFIALSGACGGGDDDGGVPAEYETVPGPAVPQPGPERSLAAEGSVEITPTTGAVTAATLETKITSTSSTEFGKQSGYILEMDCGDEVAHVELALYFSQGTEVLVVELETNRWRVAGRSADVVPSRSQSADAGGVGDAAVGDGGADDGGADAEAGVTPDASVAPPPPDDPVFVNGVGLPGVDGRREISVTLVSNGVRYDIHATIPWLESVAPATCQTLKPGTGTNGSGGGGCGGGSSSRSSGGDWD